jgi:cell wall assembly regulator SMI1
MKEIWEQIEGFLKEHVPIVIETLNNPATDKDLSQIESEIGNTLPEDFKNYLLVHNGQDDPSRLHTLCEEGTLLSSEAIIQIYRMLNEINESGDIGPVEWWSRKYLPISDCEGDHLALNLETGEIVMHVHDSGIEDDIAGSFKEWFESKLLIFKQGKFSVDEGYLDYWEYSS